MINKIKNDEKFYICAHRGYSSEYPENTLIAFQEAIKLGVDMVECDVRLSKDNVVMVIHDDKVDRTTNGEGFVADMTCDQLKELDAWSKFGEKFAGTRIPTFKEFCELVAPYKDLLINVEVKPSPTALKATEMAMETLEEYDLLNNCVINSFDAEVITYARDNYSVATQGYADYKMKNFVNGSNGTYSKMSVIGLKLENKEQYSQVVQEFEEMGIIPSSYVTDDEESVNFVIDSGCKITACDNLLPALGVVKERGLY